ncbi:hypothetical protein BXZ70DRAFT_1026871 [Cristinia sonorae]|uniref:Uncharacterized protein n=1 Tax=Cristinia sonorae TaxID=1940300 RepID=A0A8K0ULH8_9AGAR|nr:hypothetical protein BXZ70DRAFT_1026871 [Cristinia sonorae]
MVKTSPRPRRTGPGSDPIGGNAKATQFQLGLRLRLQLFFWESGEVVPGLTISYGKSKCSEISAVASRQSPVGDVGDTEMARLPSAFTISCAYRAYRQHSSTSPMTLVTDGWKALGFDGGVRFIREKRRQTSEIGESLYSIEAFGTWGQPTPPPVIVRRLRTAASRTDPPILLIDIEPGEHTYTWGDCISRRDSRDVGGNSVLGLTSGEDVSEKRKKFSMICEEDSAEWRSEQRVARLHVLICGHERLRARYSGAGELWTSSYQLETRRSQIQIIFGSERADRTVPYGKFEFSFDDIMQVWQENGEDGLTTTGRSPACVG